MRSGIRCDGHRRSKRSRLTRPCRRIASHLERDDVAGAKAVTDAALQQYPADPALHNFAGVIAAQGGDTAAAESHFQSAIRLSPRQPAAYENLGRLYQERAATDPSARSRKHSTSIGGCWMSILPTSEGLYQVGFLLALQGQFAESQTILERLPAEIRERPQILSVSAVRIWV